MKARLTIFILVLLITAACAAQEPEPTATPSPVPTPSPAPTATPEWLRAGWEMVWQDEFDGEEIDSEKWVFDIGAGAGGWGNNESQFYTDRPENARLEDGLLVIEAREEFFIDHPFFILLNLAIGGDWPGEPDDTTVFPQFMYVDFVRIYQKN